MLLIEVVAWLMVVFGLAAMLYYRIQQSPSTTASVSRSDDPLDTRIAFKLRKLRRERGIRVLMGSFLAVLCGAILLSLVYLHHPHTPGPDIVQPDALTQEFGAIRRLLEQRLPPLTPANSPSGQSIETVFILPRWIIYLLGTGMLGVGVVLLFASNVYAKAAGLALTLVGGGTTVAGKLVDKFEIGSLVKIEKPNIEFSFPKKPVIAGGRLDLVGLMDSFESGHDALPEGWQNTIETIKNRWLKERRAGRPATLVIIGSTDRRPLIEKLRKRYETNVGLARARAESVRTSLINATQNLEEPCRISGDNTMVMISGPQHTPETTSADELRIGHSKDRRVEVWIQSSSSEELPRAVCGPSSN